MKKIFNIDTEPVLVTNPKNISYIMETDFEGFWLLLYKKNIFIITSEMIKGQIEQHLKRNNIKDTKIFVIKKSFGDSVIDICNKKSIKEIVIDVSDISYFLFKSLNDKLKQNKISVIADNKIFAQKRTVKDTSEIKNIRKACEIVSQVFEIVQKKTVSGMTELDLHFEIEKEFAARHVVQSFKTIVASGENSANPHHVSGTRKIRKNDIVLIDMGCIYKGYCSDLTRTFFIGTPAKEYKKIWDIVKLAHDTALYNVKKDIKASDIDRFARNIINRNGYGKNFIHTTGHGVGLDIHESPSISSKSEDILKEGMIITVEPGIYLQNKFGIRIEDTVLVTKNGFEVLTTAKY